MLNFRLMSTRVVDGIPLWGVPKNAIKGEGIAKHVRGRYEYYDRFGYVYMNLSRRLPSYFLQLLSRELGEPLRRMTPYIITTDQSKSILRQLMAVDELYDDFGNPLEDDETMLRAIQSIFPEIQSIDLVFRDRISLSGQMVSIHQAIRKSIVFMKAALAVGMSTDNSDSRVAIGYSSIE